MNYFNVSIYTLLDEKSFKEWVESNGDKFSEHFETNYDPFELFLIKKNGDKKSITQDDVVFRTKNGYFSMSKEEFEKI